MEIWCPHPFTSIRCRPPVEEDGEVGVGKVRFAGAFKSDPDLARPWLPMGERIDRDLYLRQEGVRAIRSTAGPGDLPLWDAISSATTMAAIKKTIGIGMCGNAIPNLRCSGACSWRSSLAMLMILSPPSEVLAHAQEQVVSDLVAELPGMSCIIAAPIRTRCELCHIGENGSE